MQIPKGFRARRPGAFVLWFLAYTIVVVLPLPLGLIQLDPGRGFWINLSVALGFVGLSMFGLQFVMAARSNTIVHPIGIDLVLRFHRQMAYVATVFVLAHPIILFLIDSRFLGLLDVFTSPLRAKFAVGSIAALLVLILLSTMRQRLRVSYETWQLTHAILTLLVVVLALGHVLLVGYYVREWWEQALWVVLSAIFIALGIWVRIIKPILRRKRRWVIESIAPDHGGTTAITLRLLDPTSYGPRGFHFEAGQFAWILARRSPFSITYHPFSFTTSAERPDRVSFTIKWHEGFSREVADLTVGESLYLDGPYGSFVLPPSGPVVLIGAGVGVTPLLSMLQTIADQDEQLPHHSAERRQVHLWLGNRDEASITGLETIEALQERMPLHVVHVLSKPSDAWTGARGHLDAEFIREHLPEQPNEHTYLICGPDPLMDAVEHGLLAAGVHRDRIESERFGMV